MHNVCMYTVRASNPQSLLTQKNNGFSFNSSLPQERKSLDAALHDYFVLRLSNLLEANAGLTGL